MSTVSSMSCSEKVCVMVPLQSAMDVENMGGADLRL